MRKYGVNFFPDISIISSTRNFIASSRVRRGSRLALTTEAVLDKPWLCLYLPPLRYEEFGSVREVLPLPFSQSSPSIGTLPLRMTQSQSEHAPANGQDAEGHGAATFWALALGSMGVVFGDIGTSPLYAFKVALEAAGASHGDVSRSHRARRAVADPLVAHSRRYGEICVDPASRRQQGRRRNLVADGAGDEGDKFRALSFRRACARHGRGGAVLWRRSHHASDLGDLGGRRLGDRGAAASIPMSCRSPSSS